MVTLPQSATELTAIKMTTGQEQKQPSTTQSSNSFESAYKCVFNPLNLFGTVLPGNKTGQTHFDRVKKLGVGIGDLTITYKLDKNNKPVDSIIWSCIQEEVRTINPCG